MADGRIMHLKHFGDIRNITGMISRYKVIVNLAGASTKLAVRFR